MTDEITVTHAGDHYEMAFGGSPSTYPVPESAVESLDDELTPDDEGESVRFSGEYGGHKHMKSFDVDEVHEVPGDDDSEQKSGADSATDSDEDRTELERIETTDEAPGVDIATVREGDVLELVSGEPGNEGAHYRVVDDKHLGGLGGEGGSLNVERCDGGSDQGRLGSRERIGDNGSGPIFEPVSEANHD